MTGLWGAIRVRVLTWMWRLRLIRARPWKLEIRHRTDPAHELGAWVADYDVRAAPFDRGLVLLIRDAADSDNVVDVALIETPVGEVVLFDTTPPTARPARCQAAFVTLDAQMVPGTHAVAFESPGSHGIS